MSTCWLCRNCRKCNGLFRIHFHAVLVSVHFNTSNQILVMEVHSLFACISYDIYMCVCKYVYAYIYIHIYIYMDIHTERKTKRERTNVHERKRERERPTIWYREPKHMRWDNWRSQASTSPTTDKQDREGRIGEHRRIEREIQMKQCQKNWERETNETMCTNIYILKATHVYKYVYGYTYMRENINNINLYAC